MVKSTKVKAKKKAKSAQKAISLDVLDTKEVRDYIRYLGSPVRVFLLNFLAGTARGLGFLIGTVVVLGLAAVIIGQYLTQIPWLGELFQWLDGWLQSNLSTYQANLPGPY